MKLKLKILCKKNQIYQKLVYNYFIEQNTLKIDIYTLNIKNKHNINLTQNECQLG